MPAVKAYMARPYTTDYTRKIPLTGGSSVDGKRYFVDPDVPQSLRPFVLWHERVEKAIRDVLDKSYAYSHRIATCAERLLVEKRGKSWEAYKKAVARPVRYNEARGPEKEPVGFDKGPYRESGESRLIK